MPRSRLPGGDPGPVKPSASLQTLTNPRVLCGVLVAASLVMVLLDLPSLFQYTTFTLFWVATLAPIGASVSVLFIRRAPWVVVATALLAFAATDLAVLSSPMAYLLIAVASAGVGAWGRRPQLVVPITAVVSVVIELLHPVYGVVGIEPKAVPIVYTLILVLLICALGLAVGLAARHQQQILAQLRSQNTELAELQRRETDAALAIERTRIARDLHDVVAHHISALLLHAEAGEQLSQRTAPDQVERWTSVVDVARETMLSMRRTVGLLRTDDGEWGLAAPQPRLDELPQLAATARRNGLDVRIETSGEINDLPADIQLCAYRVVQEGLTNTLRHASATNAVATVTRTPGLLVIDIADDGKVAKEFRPGTGLVGMRERVASAGGRLTINAQEGTGLRIIAVLPLADLSRVGERAPIAPTASPG